MKKIIPCLSLSKTMRNYSRLNQYLYTNSSSLFASKKHKTNINLTCQTRYCMSNNS